jgi:hypothetical protein
MHHDRWVLTQAYLWNGIFDNKHKENVKLEKELAVTKQELRSTRIKYNDALWTLHELSNGAGHAAIRLYTAGQLQPRIQYAARSRLQARIWRAESEMEQDVADQAYPLPWAGTP